MGETKFTPGPWRTWPAYGTNDSFCFYEIGQEDSVQSFVHAHRNCVLGIEREVCEANARLIAAAPELYAVAERALRHFESTERDFDVTMGVADDLRAALKKARGL